MPWCTPSRWTPRGARHVAGGGAGRAANPGGAGAAEIERLFDAQQSAGCCAQMVDRVLAQARGFSAGKSA